MSGGFLTTTQKRPAGGVAGADSGLSIDANGNVILGGSAVDANTDITLAAFILGYLFTTGRLDLKQVAGITQLLQTGAPINFGTSDAQLASIVTNGIRRLTASATGAIGIGTDTPGEELEVVGDIISAGTLWTALTTLDLTTTWQAVAYGNGVFVAVGNAGTNRVASSLDGINWTIRTPAEVNTWNDVTYGKGLFVAVASTGTNRVMTSPDGITWTARAASQANAWIGVTYANGLYIAVSSGGTNRVMTSPDATTWTNQTAAAANSWQAVTYGAGLYVAVSRTGTNRAMSSPDGVTWTSRSIGSFLWNDIVFANGLFVAVNDSQGVNNSVATSPDGITWTLRSVPATTPQQIALACVTYGAGLFVALGNIGTQSQTVITSPDGITWTLRNDLAAGAWADVVYGNGLFVAIGASGAVNRNAISGKQQRIMNLL